MKKQFFGMILAGIGVWCAGFLSLSCSSDNNDDTEGVAPASVEAVDLGLSVKWANCNVGAATAQELGGYYGWGDPTGVKNSTVLDDYPSVEPPLSISGTSYDIARATWGSKWRMPTWRQMQELIDSCTWSWEPQNNVPGMKVTGPSGKSIFLPAAGSRSGAYISDNGYYGYYWTGSLNTQPTTDGAWYLYFDNSKPQLRSDDCRYYGNPVRPVATE